MGTGHKKSEVKDIKDERSKRWKIADRASVMK
jgi:hypothetical protein